MKIQLLSDLHLETHPHWQATPAPGADVLVLAGDIGSYQPGHQMPDADFGLRQFSPLHGWPTPVVFVPGNHEYDTLDFDVAHARLRETCERLGMVWLERASFVTPWTDQQGRPLRFVGTTLWSDYDALGDVHTKPAKAPRAPRKGAQAAFVAPAAASLATDPLTHRLRQREKAFRAANFYLTKMASQRHGRLFDAEAMRALALDCQHWLRSTLDQPFDGRTVVVTHFAPTLHSADPRYGLSPGTAGFCNGLDELLPLADLWLHGHLHCPTDVQVGRCRIVANPLGYADKQEQRAFVPQQLIRIP